VDWLLNRPIAHRGLHRGQEIPENSMLAFEAALANYHPIELDIQLLADGKVAVFHDHDLQRLTGQPGLITQQTSETIQSLRLFQTDQTVPLLSDVLDFINGQVPVLIELKNEGEVGAVEAAVLEVVSTYRGEFAIQAFNPFSLEFFKHKAPNIRRGQLSGNFDGEDLAWHKKFLLSNLLLNNKSEPNFIAYDLRALPSIATSWNRRLFKTPLIAWTVRTEEDRKKALAYADNFIFDAV
jgi:glycerophosphoryl diester phosphodiesterase